MTPAERANQIWTELGWERVVDAAFKKRVKALLAKHIAWAEVDARTRAITDQAKYMADRGLFRR